VNNSKILVMMHESLVPPSKMSAKERLNSNLATEYDVVSTLRELNYEVMPLGLYDQTEPITKAITEWQPDIVFNLMEEFNANASLDHGLVSFLELHQVPYTGCNPQGLILARNKALSKKILDYHDINTARFEVFPINGPRESKDRDLNYPVIVKCLKEEGSLGLSQSSIVYNRPKLIERVKYIHKKYQVDAIAEEFIEGREFFLGILGNHQVETLPVWELIMKNSKNPSKEFYSDQAKFNLNYRQRKGIITQKAHLPAELEAEMIKLGLETYSALQLNGYARIDFRMDKNNKVYVLEANPNPNIALDDEFALSAQFMGLTYPNLLKKIIKLGIEWHQVKMAA
jgi:D-alanine-D-alanine ligase